MVDLPRILAVEDDPGIARLLRGAFKPSAFRLSEAASCSVALAQAAGSPPDLVLLDLGLPDADGLEFLAKFRRWSEAPVIVLSARQREDDKVRALEAGADDYLTKPFGIAELQARANAALRRASRAKAPQDPVFRHGDLEVDFAAHRVRRGGADVHLTALEFRLLAHLARHAGKVLTHNAILKEVWGPARQDENHYLRVQVSSLRRKIEADPARPKHLLTELGVGYRLGE